ncbi:MAG: hypothetical protein FJ088_13100 [Deltaproteobacteria bacterium]|nr:hypothetical protein [Deltaproteobacteria bacterium]
MKAKIESRLKMLEEKKTHAEPKRKIVVGYVLDDGREEIPDHDERDIVVKFPAGFRNL